MRAYVIFCAVLLAHYGSAIPSTSSYLTDNDSVRLRQVLDASWDMKDLSTIHYSILGYKLLNHAVPKPQDVCKAILLAWDVQGDASVEVYYHISSAWKALEVCGPVGSLSSSAVSEKLNEVAISDSSSVVDIYYSVLALKALGKRPTDVGKLLKNLQAALKKDDSAINLGYSFHVAASLCSEGGCALFNRIEDAIAQADEVSSMFLQFEGGLSITALVVSGTYKLAAIQNKPPPLTHEQATKFANYFLSRRSVQTAKGVYNLLDVLHILASNKYHLPVCVALEGSNAVSAGHPKVSVKISNVLGKAITQAPLSVIAESATHIGDEVVILSKKKFEHTSDKTLYALNLMEDKPSPGQYKIVVSAALTQPDARLPSNVATSIIVKAMCSVEVSSFEIGTADADQTTQPKMNKVVYPSKLSSSLEADSQQKVVVRFQLVDPSTKQPLNVHQAFLRLWNAETRQEIIFNSDRDSSKNYKFDMDVGAKDPDFGYLSGLFRVDLIVGDAIISNPLMWHVADLKLLTPTSESKSRTLSSHADLFKPKPEIKHMFREPEKRPAAVVSNLFTALVCLPLLILFGLWAKLGVNISNFPFSLSAVGFHIGLASIFGLFGVFWLKLNMFTTIKYLIALGLVTFLSGNKMLAQIAGKRKVL